MRRSGRRGREFESPHPDRFPPLLRGKNSSCVRVEFPRGPRARRAVWRSDLAADFLSKINSTYVEMRRAGGVGDIAFLTHATGGVQLCILLPSQ